MMHAGAGRHAPACAAAVSLAAGLIGFPGRAIASPPPGDPAAGERVYVRCIGCHSPERHRTGPRHCGLVGRVSGTAAGYDYSPAMREAAITWNAETLDAFLQAPLAAVPGTTMGFAGIADRGERRDLIRYLETLTSASRQCRSATAAGEGENLK
ncbi:MAG TPA: c-type cytochrome [Woeseiaceae bacterium]|nr:c-type cytochrome [Woeseiaceae bacterium]